MDAERFVIALVKKDTGDRYVFLFGRGNYHLLGSVLATYARDPELSFSWEDASTVAIRAHRIIEDAKTEVGDP